MRFFCWSDWRKCATRSAHMACQPIGQPPSEPPSRGSRGLLRRGGPVPKKRLLTPVLSYVATSAFGPSCLPRRKTLKGKPNQSANCNALSGYILAKKTTNKTASLLFFQPWQRPLFTHSFDHAEWTLRGDDLRQPQAGRVKQRAVFSFAALTSAGYYQHVEIKEPIEGEPARGRYHRLH
jgi:hypothetical protein